jgi:hypothetical protein
MEQYFALAKTTIGGFTNRIVQSSKRNVSDRAAPF